MSSAVGGQGMSALLLLVVVGLEGVENHFNLLFAKTNVALSSKLVAADLSRSCDG